METKENEWLPKVKNDVISTASCKASYKMALEELTSFGKKNSLTLHTFASKYLNTLGDENLEQLYTYADPFMKIFVRISIKGASCIAFNQHYQSENAHVVSENISKNLNVNGYIIDP